MTDAARTTYQPRDQDRWTVPPGEVDAALDELSDRSTYFEVYDDTGGEEVVAAAETLEFDTENSNNDSDAFTYSSGELTINEAGTYLVTFSV